MCVLLVLYALILMCFCLEFLSLLFPVLCPCCFGAFQDVLVVVPVRVGRRIVYLSVGHFLLIWFFPLDVCKNL